MRYLTTLAIISLLIVPPVARAQQISPNPNPAGNTITLDTAGAVNFTNVPFDNHGLIKITGGSILDIKSGGMLTNKFGGTLINESDGYGTNFGILINEPGGTFTNNGMWEAVRKIINQGTLTNTFLFSVDGTLTNNRSLIANGMIDTSAGTFTNNGTLSGHGQIKGSYTDHGYTKPGNSVGVLTIDGDYFKVDGGKEIELGGLFDGGGDNALVEFDWIDVTSNLELTGTLDVKLIDDFELQPGHVFNFLRAGGVLSGQYDELSEGELVGNFGGQDLFIKYGGGDGNDVTLFTAVPEPTTTVLIGSLFVILGIIAKRRV